MDPGTAVGDRSGLPGCRPSCRRSSFSRTRPRPVNDTGSPACCLVRELPLATLNIKDFSDFSEHEGLVLLS